MLLYQGCRLVECIDKEIEATASRKCWSNREATGGWFGLGSIKIQACFPEMRITHLVGRNRLEITDRQKKV